MEIITEPKNAEIFYCEKCDYRCSKKSDWSRHITRRKHTMEIYGNDGNEKNAVVYQCNRCSKEFKTNSGLWKHHKKCTMILSINNNTNTVEVNKTTTIDKTDITHKLVELIMTKNHEFMTELVSQINNSVTSITTTNKDVMEKMMEMMPAIGNITNNTNSNNTTNNQFNIQMFLNEHCKNAMNLTDFIESLPITAATFDNTIENGLTKTVTNMITHGLSKLDILERPIHCTDATRKTLYVKEANVWEKDTELKKVLSGITNLIVKKRDLICKWKEANRGWDTVESKQIRFTELVCNIMTDVERDEKETGKIIRAISKMVYLDNEDKKKYIC
jgi:hypothetical protein